MTKSELILPNTILIGAQKAATTSLYNWISQHPQVCGPSALKDYSFFTYDKFYNQGLESLHKIYEKEFKGQNIRIHGSVNYMFFEYAIKRIHDFDKEVNLIVSLRNPIDRAISAFEYQIKTNRESNTIFSQALNDEAQRMVNGSFLEQAELTYYNHGLYFQQLTSVFKYFPKNQVKVVFYEDISKNPSLVVLEIYKFLQIDESFIPTFKTMNRTGVVRNKLLHQILYSKNPLKKFVVKYLLNPVFPLERRLKFKSYINEVNTKEVKRGADNYSEERNYLKRLFENDIRNLEELLDVDLSHWRE